MSDRAALEKHRLSGRVNGINQHRAPTLATRGTLDASRLSSASFLRSGLHTTGCRLFGID